MQAGKQVRNIKMSLRQNQSERTSDTGDGLLAGEIGDMDESVVERGVDVSDTEDELALSNLRTESSRLGLCGLDLLGGLHPNSRQSIHPNCMLCAVHYHSCCVLAA